MSQYKINRWLKTKGTVGVKPQLHVFADASKYGYGYVAYRRTEHNGNVDVKFLFSKARVIPEESARSRHHNLIPRFELQAALQAVEFKESFIQEAGEEYEEYYFWSDSECVLKQIADRKSRFETFVFNRISKIRADSQVNEWHYVKSADNPADFTSRGLEAKETEKWEILHNGPKFLRRRKENWNEETVPDTLTKEQIGALSGEEMQERRKTGRSSELLECIEKISGWVKKKRVIVLNFKEEC